MAGDINFDLGQILPEKSMDALLYPTCKDLGILAGGLVTAITKPLLKWSLCQQQDIDDYQNKIQKNLNTIPEDQLATDKFGMAIKALNDSRFQLGDEGLREMFAKLIATTFDKRKNENLVPLFSSLLSNMSPKEAGFLKKWYEKTKVSHFNSVVINMVQQNSIGTQFPLLDGILVYPDGSMENDALNINLLESAGLMVRYRGRELKHELFQKQYISAENYFKSIKVPQEKFMPDCHLESERGYVILTELGKMFTNVLFD
ncbi:DUF4393 domain-containing protein [Oenococcus kitaharae]|uniref:DUF4393 domain-containing protein n=1 Tax=Oenococcus kitaharae DSM 17330 TaxID=1045004 RepID=G9WGU1_9LACO|nr:DUF4393 domain-containing protein [Oenococcus kitaharae]EHN59349.1 hypothetical protein OKIT_1266 [Oenococcus kitaharae DSM 17330]